ncbi:hypothetical protein ES705_12363 [subsurface metagenome]
MYENDKMKYPEKEKKLQIKRIFETVVTITLFLFSLSVLFFTVSYLFHFTDFAAMLPFSLIKIFKDDPAGHVMSYLSTDSKETVQKDVILLLEKKREELYRIEGELKTLEDEKKLFLYSMGQKKKVFQENISIIDVSEIRNNLKSIVQLNKSELRFHNEAERRINLYLNIHQKKREELLGNKEQITRELAELTGLMQNLKNEKGVEKFPGDKAFFTGKGFAVTNTVSSKGALGIIAKSPFDYIIIDLDLDNGNGLNLVKSMKLIPKTKNSQFIITGKIVKNKSVEQAIHLGVRGFLKSPFDPEKLSQIIK